MFTSYLARRPLDIIDGVYVIDLHARKDERGQFAETFRAAWFPEVSWEQLQANRSDSAAGVLRGLHYHFHQADYWHVVRGSIRVGLADLRPESSTFMKSHVLELNGDTPQGLFIPVGVAHGFYALTDCTLTYVVNKYYDASDERGVAWDDPDLAVAWGITEPVLSSRDSLNRRLAEIPQDERL